jgi:mono/diheme cytochrome c family protein
MRLICFSFFLTVLALPAWAADPHNGKRLAKVHCEACHTITQRKEVADSPPFEVIGRKFGFNSEQIAASIINSHPRMNLMLRRNEALDIAAYIASLNR